jgi:hypothetical protein
MPTEQKRGLADPWRALRDREWHTDADDPKLARFLAELACGQTGTKYVAHGLLRRLSADWSQTKRPFAPLLAIAIRDPSCAHARDLTPDEKGQLDRIIKEAGSDTTKGATVSPQATKPDSVGKR